MGTRLRVIAAHSDRGVADGGDRNLVGFRFPRRLERPLPGDWIELDADGTPVRIEPRRNTFGRGDRRGRFRPIAANLDQIIIVIAPQPAPSHDLLHRYLVAARIQGIEALIVVNKSDLGIPEAPPFDELAGLAGLGYRVVETRCEPKPELAGLSNCIDERTSLLAGQSGVGKSSMLNALIPDLAVQTGALSRVTGKGTHTTTSATLHPLPGGGWLVDTPGVWEFSLWRLSDHELERAFPEFASRGSGCRFRDCRHRTEPGCGVHAAVEAGRIPAFRHQSWLRLLDEQDRIGS